MHSIILLLLCDTLLCHQETPKQYHLLSDSDLVAPHAAASQVTSQVTECFCSATVTCCSQLRFKFCNVGMKYDTSYQHNNNYVISYTCSALLCPDFSVSVYLDSRYSGHSSANAASTGASTGPSTGPSTSASTTRKVSHC